MIGFQPTLNQFIRAREKEFPEAIGEFSQVMNALALAGKLISREINLAGQKAHGGVEPDRFQCRTRIVR